ncbi:MAG: hypothetical protein FJ189_12985 [Gammaproteobacteria bacterium]|nr:hypothetical protein [Gammaproteobacteria bacterium]
MRSGSNRSGHANNVCLSTHSRRCRRTTLHTTLHIEGCVERPLPFAAVAVVDRRGDGDPGSSQVCGTAGFPPAPSERAVTGRRRPACLTASVHLIQWYERFAAKYGFWRPIVERSVKAFLKCGDLHEGFARVRCADCHHDSAATTWCPAWWLRSRRSDHSSTGTRMCMSC